MYRWHAWAGLLSGIFLIIICVSGSVAVFKPEIQRAVDWGGYNFDVRPVGDPITPTEAVEVVESRYPDTRALSISLPALPGSIQSHGPTYSIKVAGTKTNPSRDVLVDPYKAEIVAEARLNNGWGNWLRQLHLRLLYGSFWGRWVVGFFGIVLTFATISGLLIYARFNAGKWKPVLRTGRGSRVLWADIHKLVGIGALVFNLIFGVTGAVLGLETLYSRYFAARPAAAQAETSGGDAAEKPEGAGEPASKPASKPARQVREGMKELPPGMLEACLAKAKTIMPGAEPASVDLQYRRNATLRVRMEHGALALIKEGQSNIVFDARTGEPTKVNDASLAPAMTRVYYSMEPLHFGRLGGSMIIKLLWGIMGLTGGILSITGYGIYLLRWWKKRAARRKTARIAAPSLA